VRRLEQQFQGELDLARRICRADGSERRAGGYGGRDSEVGVIRHVEELRPELELYAFMNREGLVGGEVPLFEAWGAEGVPS
jgi:hypothetical protein